MKYKYGEFSKKQLKEAARDLQKRIYFLLLLVDKNTCKRYEGVDVNKAFDNLLKRLGGLNKLLFYPKEIVNVSALLVAAVDEYNSDNFEWGVYRKLILDAGNEVVKIGGA